MPEIIEEIKRLNEESKSQNEKAIKMSKMCEFYMDDCLKAIRLCILKLEIALGLNQIAKKIVSHQRHTKPLVKEKLSKVATLNVEGS